MGKGLVFGIQHFSIHDGPGIRSTVFLKGCPLRCLWCHNPEGLSCDIGVQYYKKDCMHCGKCGYIYEKIYEIEKLSTEEKRKIVNTCPHNALRLIGEYLSVNDVMEEIIKDKRYFKTSKGGLTISGGEPMMQTAFACDLARTAKENGITTALETSGYTSLENYKRILPFIDTFLWDYKATGEELHKELIGVSNSKIIANLDFIYNQGANIILRCPLIPGINDTDVHLKAIAEMHKKYPNLAGIEIMPYHKMGVSKAKRVGIVQNEFLVPDKILKAYWYEKIIEYGGKLTHVN